MDLDKEKLNGSECDLVMQDKNTFFFEVKKTPITNELENVDDVTMLQQLAKGMVKAQKQCFSHELYLELNGSICLDDNGRENILRSASEQDCCFKITLVVKVVVSKTLKLLLHSFRLSDDTPYLP